MAWMHAYLQYFPANSQSHLKVNKTESFGDSDITVCLESPEGAEIESISHNFMIIPQVVVLNFTNIGICFIAPYNIVHNVSIISNICGVDTVNSVLEIYYGK